MWKKRINFDPFSNTAFLLANKFFPTLTDWLKKWNFDPKIQWREMRINFDPFSNAVFWLVNSFFLTNSDWPKKWNFDPLLKYKNPTCKFRKLVVSYTSNKLQSKCLDVEKEAKPNLRPRPDPSGLDFSSLLDVSTDTWREETMLRELELVPQSTWLLCLSTWALRSSSWLATLPVTTRKPGSSQDICNWLSETTRSWTNFCQESPLLLVVFCPTSKLSFCPRRPRRKPPNRFLSEILPTFKQTAIFIATQIIKETFNYISKLKC